jgi:hypothetical protein
MTVAGLWPDRGRATVALSRRRPWLRGPGPIGATVPGHGRDWRAASVNPAWPAATVTATIGEERP